MTIQEITTETAEVLKENVEEIKSDVLAEDVVDSLDGFTKEFDINGEKVTLSVKKV